MEQTAQLFSGVVRQMRGFVGYGVLVKKRKLSIECQKHFLEKLFEEFSFLGSIKLHAKCCERFVSWA